MRLDPLTQSVTAPAPAAAPKPVQMPLGSVAPTEQVSRFVAASDEAACALAYESAYAAVRLRRRMTGQISGLATLDDRLAGAAAGLRDAPDMNSPAEPASDAAALSAARLAELRAAAGSLNVAISGARSDVAAILQQMQAELGAAIDALSKGASAADAGLDGAVATASGNGETLIRRANLLDDG